MPFDWRTGDEYFPLDELLRQHGWVLDRNGRPANAESIWQRDSITCTHSVALNLLLLQYGWERSGDKWQSDAGVFYRDEALASLLKWINGVTVRELMDAHLD